MSRAMSFLRPFLIALTALAADACAVGPAYHAPVQAPVALTAVDPHLVVASSAPEATWWKTFGDPELDSLVQRALASNLDVRIAVARVREARALFRDTRLNLLPRVTT